MTPFETFKDQMTRLKANYGRQHFPDERCKMFWEELSGFSAKQIKSICDALMGECHFAPTVAELRGKCALLREKIHRFERDQERHRAEEFYSSLPDSEMSHIMQTLRRRIKGQMPDHEFVQFKEILKKTGGE